jgi:hypothetical protein
MSADRHTTVRPARRRDARRRTPKQRVGLTLLLAGLALLALSNLGARAGFTVLPFDPHHAIGQFVLGPAFALLGATLLGRDR